MYAGYKPWNVTTNFAQRYEDSSDPYEPYKIEMKYKLVDVNRYSNMELIFNETLLSCVMLMEKARNKQELLEIIQEILDNLKNIEILPQIREYLINMQEGRLNLEEIITIINEKEEEGRDKMSTLCDRLKYENEMIRKKAREQGITKTIVNVARNMLQKHEKDEKIIEYTNITPQELEKIKKEIKIKIQ